jgi:hypothetical protein
MDERQQGASRRLTGNDTWWIVPVGLVQTVEPTARVTDPITSHMAAQAQTPAKVRSEHRLVLELLQWEALDDFELAKRASQALGRPVKQTSIGVRRGELRRIGLVADSGLKGKSDTGSPVIRWCLTDAGHKELAS